MSNSNSSGGIGFLGLLQIVFIVLKLVGTINWSWWWVMAPTWGPFALIIVCIPLVVLYYAIKSRR